MLDSLPYTPALNLLHQHVQVHSILTMPDRDARVDAGERANPLTAQPQP
jgi:hypothetical protein